VRVLPGWLREGLLLLVLLLAWVLVVMAVRRAPLHHVIDLSQPVIAGEAQIAGLYGLEQNDEFAYRWTSGSFLAQWPWAYQLAPHYIALVRAQAGPVEPRTLTFLGNERPLASTTPGAEFRVYRLLLPPVPADDTSLRLALAIDPARETSDARPLGLILTDIELQALPFLDPLTLVLVPLGLTLLWALARRRGASIGGALLLCAPLAAALLMLYARMNLAPLPYLTMTAFSLAAAAVAVLLTRSNLIRLGLALLGLVVSFSGMLWASWLSDDAFISFHYAQNLVQGHGLVYNPGERVEGYTNFLYTMLAALLLWLGADLVLWSYLSGIGFALALMLLTYTLGARLIGPGWGFVAALFVATSQSLLLHSARGGGLETALYALLLLSAASVYLWGLGGPERRAPTPRALAFTGLLLALASLTRPEGALLLALTIFHAFVYDINREELRPGNLAGLLRRKLGLAALLGPYLLLVVPFFFWRYSYYGDLLPNTFYAKTGGGLRAVVRGLDYSRGFAQSMGGPLLLLGLGGLVADWRGALRGWRGYMLLLVGVYTLYIIAVGGDHFRGERFFVPLVALIAILLADGLALLMGAATARPALRLVAPALLVLLLGVYSYTALNRTRDFDYIMRGMDEGLWIWREIGWWMADHTTPEESIAARGAGAIAFYGQRTTIDMLGLTDRHIARVEVPDMGAGAAGHEKRAPDYVLNVRRPTYIPYMWSDYFPSEAYLEQDYEIVTITTRYGRELLMWQRRQS
jgi:arabinofuranosyltransferase